MPPRLLPQGWEVRMGTRLPRPPRLQGSTDLSRDLLGRVPGVPEDPSLPDPHPPSPQPGAWAQHCILVHVQD